MEKYWNEAISFEEYMNVADQRANNPKDEQEKEFHGYYELGLQRMNRALKTYKPDENQREALASKNFKGKVLIITEPWCGDASATVPQVSKFFESENEVRIFLRDNDLSLIDQFLTNGTQSIPKVVLLDEDFSVINSWGPRPKFGLELLEKYKADPVAFPQEEFYNQLQVYYAKNRGKDAIGEILELL